MHTYVYSPSRCCSPLCEESALYTPDDSMGVLQSETQNARGSKLSPQSRPLHCVYNKYQEFQLEV